MRALISSVGAALCLASAAATAGTATLATPSFTSIELRPLAASPGNVVATGINHYGDIVGASDGNPFIYYHRNGTVVQLGGVAGEQAYVAGVFPLEWTSNGGVVTLPTETLGMANSIGNNGDIGGNIDNG